MKTRIVQIMLVPALLFWVGGCAILQRESPEKKARELMVAFQQSLGQPDEVVLKFFDTDQSLESLLAAISILQNKDSEFVSCAADFSNMSIEVVELDESLKKIFKDDRSVVKVTVPSTLQSRNSENPQEQPADLVFYLTEKNGKFIISKLDGDSFYNTFTSMKHDIQYASHIQDEIKEREAIYELARNLEEKFDTLVWYVRYSGKVYFYAVSGEWNVEALYKNSNVPRPYFKMGLIDETGKEIIPISFDMIGTIGFDKENAVEVNGPSGYGYFSLDGDTLVTPSYTQIIPYFQANGWIVQSEGRFGFVNNQGQYTDGFINDEAAKYVKEFSFLPMQATVSEANYSLCESPRHDGAGTGHFIAPSYWVNTGLFDPIKFGLTTTASDTPIGGWTEYIEFSSVFQNITSGIGVVIANFKERYLEGREEFYEHTNLMFTNENQITIANEEFSGASIEVKKISETLIEVSASPKRTYFDMSGVDGEVLNPRSFRYFQMDDGYVRALESNRWHPETEFVKLDDSYITGDFDVYSGEMGSNIATSILPLSTLESMRNEILASYGMIFQNEETNEYYENKKWYVPRFQNESEIEGFSEIDRHNLDFLSKKIAEQKESDGDV